MNLGIFSIAEINRKTNIYDILEFISKSQSDLNEVINHLDNINYKIDLKHDSNYYYHNININAIKLLEYYNININLIDCKIISCLKQDVILYLYNNKLYNFTLNNVNFHIASYNFETIFKTLDLDVTTFRLDGLSIYGLLSFSGFLNDFKYVYETYNILPTNKDYKLNSSNNSTYILYKTFLAYDLNIQHLNRLEDKYKLIYISEYYNINITENKNKEKENIIIDLFDSVKDESITDKFIISISSESIQKIEESINLWIKIINRIGHNRYIETYKKYSNNPNLNLIIHFYSYYDYYINDNILNECNLLEKYDIKISEEWNNIYLSYSNSIIVNFYIKLKNTYNL